MINSSQPFLYTNNSGQKCLLYCYSPGLRTLKFGNDYSIRPWKIYHKNYETNTIELIPTPRSVPEYGEVVLECNPHCYLDKLYYTAGFNKGSDTPIVYYLCSLDISPLDPSQTSNFTVIQQTFTGTVVDNVAIYANPNKNGKVLKGTTNPQEFDLGLIYIYKLNKVFNEDKFIVTGQTTEKSYLSLLVDSSFDIIKELKNNNNESIYKCSLLNNELVYTLKLDQDNYESRELVEEVYNGR
jgi:hypothetical protein